MEGIKMEREQFVEKLLSNNQYPNQEYINQVKEIANDLNSEYWINEARILGVDTRDINIFDKVFLECFVKNGQVTL